MLSRLVSSRGSSIMQRSLRSTNQGLAALPALRHQELSRSFNSSSPLRVKSSLPVRNTPIYTNTPDADGLNPLEVAKKYGLTSFWGAVAAIMISKEVLLLDAEFLLGMELCTFFMTAYILTGDTITKMSEQMDKEKSDKFNDAHDFLLEMVNQYKMVQKTAQEKPAVMEQYAQEYKAALVENAKYLTIKPQLEARAQLVTALAAIQGREELQAASEWAETVTSAVDAVTGQFEDQSNTALQEQYMSLAISRIGTAKDAAGVEDPVSQLFAKELGA